MVTIAQYLTTYIPGCFDSFVVYTASARIVGGLVCK